MKNFQTTQRKANRKKLLRYLAIFLILTGLLCWCFRKPLCLFFCLQDFKAIHQKKQTIAQLKLEKKQLEQKTKFLQTPEGIEEEARKQGWVKPGERPVKSYIAEKNKEEPQKKSPRNLFQKLTNWFKNLLQQHKKPNQ